jgi:RND family efflux transporter MFP subunit
MIAGGAWLVFGRTSQTAARIPSPVGDDLGLVARVERRDITRELKMTGDVAPSFEVEIKPEVGGKVKKLYVDVNHVVTQGQLVAEIDDRDLLTEKAAAETEIAGSQLTVDRANRDFERTKQLRDRRLASQEEYDNDVSELDLARNELERSRRRLDLVDDRLRKTKIVSPANGTVLEVPVLEGQVVVAAASVNAGTTLMRIADLSKLLVKTHINQIDAAALQVGQPAILTSEALRELEIKGAVSFIAPIATAKNNIKGFEVELDIFDPGPRLRPGMTLNVTVPVESAKNVPTIPIAAVFKKPGAKTSVAWIKPKGDEASEERTIEPGISDLQFVEVKSGLVEGEEVLLAEPESAKTAM